MWVGSSYRNYPYLTANKKTVPQSYHCKGLSSANKLMNLEMHSFLDPPEIYATLLTP